jgi:hypothetical protein
MARTLTDATIGTRGARQKLARRSEPYWRAMSDGLAIGYRKGVKGGTWIARHYLAETGRQFQALGTADDVFDADGVMVFDFNRAQAAARNGSPPSRTMSSRHTPWKSVWKIISPT